MNHTQGIACRSRPHVVPHRRRVRFGRSSVTWNTPTPSSHHSCQPLTTASHAKPTGTLVEASSRSSSAPEHPQPLSFETLPSLERFMDINYVSEYFAVRQQLESLPEQPSDSCSALEIDEVIRRAEALEEEVVAVWKPYVCHGAVQLLLHIRDKDEVQTTPSKFFAQLAETKDSRLQRVADSLGIELAQLGKIADAVLARHEGAYLESLTLLESHLHLVRGITPAMDEVCPDECLIVAASKAFQLAFPEHFTEADNNTSCTPRGRPDSDSSSGRRRRKREDKRRPPAARKGEGSAGSKPSEHGGGQRGHRQPHSSYRQQDGHGGVGGGSGGTGGSKPRDRTCYFCKAPDHLAAQCPDLDGCSPEYRAKVVRAARRGDPLPPRT